MKHLRIALVLLAVMSLGIMACHRQPKGQSGKEVVVLDQGQLSFFDIKSKMVTPFEAETDKALCFSGAAQSECLCRCRPH